MNRHDMDTVLQISNKKTNISKKKQDSKKLSKSDKIKLINSNDRSKMRRRKRNFPRKAKAIIYIGHIPHGFYEDQMSEYFNQFGKVHAAIVVRSKKTGRSRGFGFVEFEDEEVAKIAAETMNNYLMYNRVLKCRYIPPEERKGPLYVRPVYSVPPKVKNRILSYKDKRKAFKSLDQSSYVKKAQKKINDFKKFFEEKGIDFSLKVNFPNSEDNKTDESKNVESESRTSCGSESEEDTDDQFGVLEIDESDNDIHFKTPPQVKKIIKRSTRATSLDIAPTKMKTQVKEQRMKLRNSSVPEIKRIAPERKEITNCIGSKLEKTTKVREKPLVKSFKPKKAQNKKGKSSKKDSATMVTRRKGKNKEKKGSENKQRK